MSNTAHGSAAHGTAAPSSEGAAGSSSPTNAALPRDVATLVFIRDRGVFILWGLLLITFAVIARPYFASYDNAMLIMDGASLTAIIAAGVAIGAMSGALDLSVPGVAALVGVVTGKLLVGGMHPLVAIALGMGVAAFLGFLNGFFTLRELNPLVVTIGTSSVCIGVATILADGYTISGLDALHFIGTDSYFNIPASAFVVGAVYLVGTVFLTKTREGVRLMAVGANAEAVRRAGVNSNAFRMLGFIISAALSGLGGIVLAAQVTEANPLGNPSLIFEALTAVALSGVSLAGGRGSLPRVLVGALILATIQNGLILLGVDPYASTVATGSLLIGSLLLDKYLTRIVADRLVATSGKK